MKRTGIIFLVLFAFALGFFLGANSVTEDAPSERRSTPFSDGEEEQEEEHVEIPEFPAWQECPDCALQSVKIETQKEYGFWGDLWTTTWAENDKVYMIFGDGTGKKDCLPTVDEKVPGEGFEPWPGVEKKENCFTISRFPEEPEEPCNTFDCDRCYEELCTMTPAGLVEMEGDPPVFAECAGENQCVIFPDVPYGNNEILAGVDKPSSMLAVGARLYAAMHWPPGQTKEGYIAYSDDSGRSWTKVEGTPWTEGSNFRVLLFINMGKAYEDRKDDFVYALAMENEIDGLQVQDMYLVRVPMDAVANYSAYEYFSGMNGDEPTWSKTESDAQKLPNITTIAQSSVIYHEGVDRYLFLSGFRSVDFEQNENMPGLGAIYEAPNPWGPWKEAARFASITQPSFITKGAGENFVYFTAAGGSYPYSLNVVKMSWE